MRLLRQNTHRVLSWSSHQEFAQFPFFPHRLRILVFGRPRSEGFRGQTIKVRHRSACNFSLHAWIPVLSALRRLLTCRAPVEYDSWLGCRLCFGLMCALTRLSMGSLMSGLRHCTFGVVLNIWLWLYAAVNLGKKIECGTMEDRSDSPRFACLGEYNGLNAYVLEGCWLCRFCWA